MTSEASVECCVWVERSVVIVSDTFTLPPPPLNVVSSVLPPSTSIILDIIESGSKLETLFMILIASSLSLRSSIAPKAVITVVESSVTFCKIFCDAKYAGSCSRFVVSVISVRVWRVSSKFRATETLFCIKCCLTSAACNSAGDKPAKAGLVRSASKIPPTNSATISARV